MKHPLCFVLMPFGKKHNGSRNIIDFDAVYSNLIAPAISEAEMQPLRADEELVGGIIHKPMFERLILCDYAVADLTTANANVFYELGVRHGLRPWSTVLIFAEGSRLPFDITPLRGLPYQLRDGQPSDIEENKRQLVMRLREARNAKPDSPVFQLVSDLNPPDVSRLKTDVFRDSVEYSVKMKNKLTIARKQGVEAVKAIEKELGKISNVESGVVIDLFLSYRAVEDWKDMIALVEKMSPPLAATVIIREQLAHALNRAGQDERAQGILETLLAERGPSSETHGLLGRIYKDRWEAAVRDGKELEAKGLIDKAINAYHQGFEADWRDAYPGINAVTLMEIRDPLDIRRLQLLPVVKYSVERRIALGKPDYWDYATRMELAILGGDQEGATKALCDALASVREVWEPKTTARNLRLIREARERRGEFQPWLKEIEESLINCAEKK
jgi:tetratricopeptide (TPR) repeat protein